MLIQGSGQNHRFTATITPDKHELAVHMQSGRIHININHLRSPHNSLATPLTLGEKIKNPQISNFGFFLEYGHILSFVDMHHIWSYIYPIYVMDTIYHTRI